MISIFSVFILNLDLPRAPLVAVLLVAVKVDQRMRMRSSRPLRGGECGGDSLRHVGLEGPGELWLLGEPGKLRLLEEPTF